MSGSQQTIYIFQCSNNRKRYGATAAQTGINLPDQDCPGGTWTPFSQTTLGPTPRPRLALDEGALRADLANQGYHLWEVNLTVRVR